MELLESAPNVRLSPSFSGRLVTGAKSLARSSCILALCASASPSPRGAGSGVEALFLGLTAPAKDERKEAIFSVCLLLLFNRKASTGTVRFAASGWMTD